MFNTIIGVDCATDLRKVGIARARRDSDRWRLVDVAHGTTHDPPAARIARWTDADSATLLALDAPLGWPVPLSQELARHAAGVTLRTSADELFRRATDRFVQRTYAKRPLDVGADRIARTAHAALVLLHELRRTTGRDIPLAWTPNEPAHVAAVEVYPAVTGKVHFDRSVVAPSGDRRADAITIIQDALSGVASHDLENATQDELDAALCVVAGADFVSGRAVPPEDAELAKREGWIWVRRTDGAVTT